MAKLVLTSPSLSSKIKNTKIGKSYEQKFDFVQLWVYPPLPYWILPPSLLKRSGILACFHPLKAFQIGLTDAGKRKFKIVPYETNHIELCNGEWQAVSTDLRSQRASATVRDFVTIPCGQCVGCRLEYSRQWANRCMLELQYHKDAWFVTLTYDDDHVPISYHSNPYTGEAISGLTLYKRDFQLWMKRLRRACGNDDIRYFAAGEYGDESFRPHFHAIVYGLYLDDLKKYKNSPQGFPYYTSEKLNATWRGTKDRFKDDSIFALKNDEEKLGMVVVAPVTWETCAYTARYVMKKAVGKTAEVYDYFNIQPEFTLMSRKPGIGYQYFEDHPEVMCLDNINISTPKGGKSFKAPKYYVRLFDVQNPEESQKIKDISSQMATAIQELKLEKTDLSYLEMLAVEEENLKKRTRTLERKL